jgi:hypothetical protein
MEVPEKRSQIKKEVWRKIVAFCILSNNNEFEKLNGMSLSYEKSL